MQHDICATNTALRVVQVEKDWEALAQWLNLWLDEIRCTSKTCPNLRNIQADQTERS